MKIKKITRILLEIEIPVYDISVSNKYNEHNFLTESGIFVHNCGTSVHDGSASTGSSTVFIEGKPVHRIGDEIDCGDISASGSRNVFAGG